MNIRVRIYGDIANTLGTKHLLQLPRGATVKHLTNHLAAKTGQTRQGHLGEFKVGGPDLAIMINGRNIQLLDGPDTQLHDQDDVVIMPFVVGG